MVHVVIRPMISWTKAVLRRNMWVSLEFRIPSHVEFVRRYNRKRVVHTFKMTRAIEIDADLRSGRFSEMEKNMLT